MTQTQHMVVKGHLRLLAAFCEYVTSLEVAFLQHVLSLTSHTHRGAHVSGPPRQHLMSL